MCDFMMSSTDHEEHVGGGWLNIFPELIVEVDDHILNCFVFGADIYSTLHKPHT